MKTIGILGGMGPAATNQLYASIIQHTPAQRDQDHIPTVIYSIPQIPDRTDALLYGGEDPTPYLLEGIKVLKSASADFVIVPCNTAHVFLERIKKISPLPILDMINETKTHIETIYPEVKKIGLLATTGTVESHIYQSRLGVIGKEVVTPTEEIQKECVMQAIYGEKGIKAGYRSVENKKLLIKALDSLCTQGAELLILGCTEISLLVESYHLPLVDPMKVVAKKAVRLALDADYKDTNFSTFCYE